MNPGSWRVFPIEVLLTIDYNELVKASMDITEEILRKWGSADVMTRKLWSKGPLEYLLPTLASLFMTDSQESKTLETMKSKQKPKVIPHPLPVSLPEWPIPADSERPSTSTQTTPRFPQSS